MYTYVISGLLLSGPPTETLYAFVRFQVLTAASMKFRIFWDVAPKSQVEVGRRFRGTA
jgi:hypothetical protein